MHRTWFWALCLFIIFTMSGYAQAVPTLPARVSLVAPNGAFRTPWVDDFKNTVVDGGTTRYFADNGSDSCGSCTDSGCPCQTLAKMRSVRQSRDNILFKRGDKWTGSIQIHNSPNGTSSDYTTYGTWGSTSDPRPIFDGNGESMNMEGRSYIWIDRLNLFDHGAIRHWQGTHHITWTLVKNHDNRQTGFNMDTRPNGNGVVHHFVFAGVDVGRTGMNWFPCAGDPEDADKGDEAFYLGNSNNTYSAGEDVHIYNTRIWGTTKEPVNFKFDSKRVTFEDNLIEDVQMCNDTSMIQSDYSGNESIVIRGNIIRNVAKPERQASVFQAGPNTLIYNNLVYDTKSTVAVIRFGDNANANTKMYHNTFCDLGGGIFNSNHDSSLNGNIRNNIGPTITDNVACNTNMFVNASSRDYRLTNTSSAKDLYSNCRGITTDIMGATRPVNTNCDAGAYEQGGTASDPGDPDPPPDPGGTLASQLYVKTPFQGGSNDTGNGSSTAPWATIQKCIDMVQASGSPSGKRCNIGAGTYAENLVVRAQASSRDAAFTIAPDPGAVVTVKPNCGTTALNVTDDARNVVFYGATDEDSLLVFDGTNITGAVVLHDGVAGSTGSSADNISYVRVHIVNGPVGGANSASGTSNIEYYNVTVQNNGSYGIRITSGSNIISHSLIKDNGHPGIWITNEGTSSPSDSVVTKTRVSNNVGTGITVEHGLRIKIDTNLVHNNSSSGIFLSETDVGTANIHFNSIYGNDLYGIREVGIVTSSMTNNIAFGNTSGEINSVANDMELESNLEEDPFWTNPAAGVFTLRSNSPAINAGSCRADITQDFTFAARPDIVTGLCDIGAYEGWVEVDVIGKRTGGQFSGGMYR